MAMLLAMRALAARRRCWRVEQRVAGTYSVDVVAEILAMARRQMDTTSSMSLLPHIYNVDDAVGFHNIYHGQSS